MRSKSSKGKTDHLRWFAPLAVGIIQVAQVPAWPGLAWPGLSDFTSRFSTKYSTKVRLTIVDCLDRRQPLLAHELAHQKVLKRLA